VGARAGFGAEFDQAIAVRRLGRTDHEQHVRLERQLLHRVLAVLRRVADVVLARQTDRREAALQRVHDLAGVVDRERRLGETREMLRIAHFETLHVVDAFDQVHAFGRTEAVNLPAVAIENWK
jgi:hypothetical protein